MMKKYITGLLVFAILLSISGCSSQIATTTKGNTTASPVTSTTNASTSSTQKSADTIKYALITSITGPNAMLGYYQKLGAEYMVNKINQQGGIKSLGGAKIELIIGDHQSDSTLVASVAERILSDKSVVACSGAGTSSYMMAMLPTIEKLKVPTITANASNSITESGYKYIFQTAAKATTVGLMQTKGLKWLNEKYKYATNKVGIIYTDNDYGLSTSKSSKTLAEAAGLTVVYDKSFPSNISDASSLILGLKSSGAEAVYLAAEASNSKLILDAMASMKYYPVIMGGGSGFLLSSFAKELGDSVLGMCSTSEFGFDSSNIKNNKILNGYVQEFHDIYKEWPTEGVMYEMSHLLILADSLERCASRDRDKIRDAIAKTSLEVLNPGGKMEFDEKGASKNSTMILGQWQKNDAKEYVFSCVYPEEYATMKFLDLRK